MSNASVIKISLTGAYKELKQTKEGKFERFVRQLTRLSPERSAARLHKEMLTAVHQRSANLGTLDDIALDEFLAKAVDSSKKR